jgi:AcrR family transcriptional regulator
VARGTRGNKRRAELLEAARDCFAEHGYHATSVDDIAKRVHVARGTFYLYFADKRAIFAELLAGFLSRIAGSIQSIDLADPSRPPREQLRANLLSLVELAEQEPAMIKLTLADAPGLTSELDEQLQTFYDALRLFIDESLEEGQKMGLIRGGDRQLYISLVLGALSRILLDHCRGTLTLSADQVVDAIMAFLNEGLLG